MQGRIAAQSSSLLISIFAITTTVNPMPVGARARTSNVDCVSMGTEQSDRDNAQSRSITWLCAPSDSAGVTEVCGNLEAYLCRANAAGGLPTEVEREQLARLVDGVEVEGGVQNSTLETALEIPLPILCCPGFRSKGSPPTRSINGSKNPRGQN